MTYLVQPTAGIVHIADALLADYEAAGWTEATDDQVATWTAADPYGGTQGHPQAPPEIAPGVAPAPVTLSNKP